MGGSGAVGRSSSGSRASEPAPAAVKSVCENTCAGFTNNGICDEGRPNAQATPESQPDSAAVFEVQCDLGTDCGDCGPWVSCCACSAAHSHRHGNAVAWLGVSIV